MNSIPAVQTPISVPSTAMGTANATTTWHDTSLPAAERVEALIEAMTLDEKLAQLYGVWVGASNEGGYRSLRNEGA